MWNFYEIGKFLEQIRRIRSLATDGCANIWGINIESNH